MIQVGRCDFCGKKGNDSGLLGFLEGNIYEGFQYCKNCQPTLVNAIVEAKRVYANQPHDPTRRPLYLTLKDNADERVKISWNGQRENSPDECEIHLVGDREEERFRVNTSFTRISKSFGELIWRSSYKIDIPLSTLIKKNRKFFGENPADFPFNIDMKIHKKEDVGFWKKMIKVSYDKATVTSDQ